MTEATRRIQLFLHFQQQKSFREIHKNKKIVPTFKLSFLGSRIHATQDNPRTRSPRNNKHITQLSIKFLRNSETDILCFFCLLAQFRLAISLFLFTCFQSRLMMKRLFLSAKKTNSFNRNDTLKREHQQF